MAAAWAHAPAATGATELSWNLRPEVAVPLLALAALYMLGWFHLRRRAEPAPRPWRAVLMSLCLATVALALLSPLDGLADLRFAAHMVQHMLLISVAAPALLLADPLPIVVWALPRAARLRARHVLHRGSTTARLWRVTTAMAPAWIVAAVLLWAWHVPAAYDAALSRRWVHDLEHLSFFIAALVFWWPVIHPAPRYRRAASHPARVVYVVLGAFQTAALGLLLTLAPTVLYRAYAGPDGLEDQALGGVVMWGLGGLVDMIAVLVLVYRSLGPGGSESLDPAVGAGPPSHHRSQRMIAS